MIQSLLFQSLADCFNVYSVDDARWHFERFFLQSSLHIPLSYPSLIGKFSPFLFFIFFLQIVGCRIARGDMKSSYQILDLRILMSNTTV